MVIFHSYLSLPEGIRYNVNPGLINPVYGCLIGGDTIKKYHIVTIWRVPPQLINHGVLIRS